MSRKAKLILGSAVGWLALVLLLIWTKDQPGHGWRVFEVPMTTVSSGLAALVVAALLFDPLKHWVARATADELEAREDHRWLKDMYPHARATQDALRHMTALGSAVLYEAVASTGALTAVIPSETLRWDVRQLPPAPPVFDTGQSEQELRDALVAMFKGLARELESTERFRSTGPMAVAHFQFEMLSTALQAHVEKEQNSKLVRIMGPDFWRPPDDRVLLATGGLVPVPDEQWDRLDEATIEDLATCPEDAVADRLAELVSRMVSMVNLVTGVRDFDPRPLTESVLELAALAERLRYLVSSPTGHALVNSSGEVSGPDLGDPWEVGRRRMIEVTHLFGALMDVRSKLLQATAETLAVASRLGENTQHAWLLPGEMPDDILGTYGSWDLWRQRNYLRYGSPRSQEGPA